MAGLRDSVNAGNNYAGEYFKLNSDLMMQYYFFGSIGSESNPFCGNFDGDDHTIDYLYSYGLFGCIDAQSGTSVTIKNLNIYNDLDFLHIHYTNSESIYFGILAQTINLTHDFAECYISRVNVTLDMGSGSKAFEMQTQSLSEFTIGGLIGKITATTCDSAKIVISGCGVDVGAFVVAPKSGEIRTHFGLLCGEIELENSDLEIVDCLTADFISLNLISPKLTGYMCESCFIGKLTTAGTATVNIHDCATFADGSMSYQTDAAYTAYFGSIVGCADCQLCSWDISRMYVRYYQKEEQIGGLRRSNLPVGYYLSGGWNVETNYVEWSDLTEAIKSGSVVNDYWAVNDAINYGYAYLVDFYSRYSVSPLCCEGLGTKESPYLIYTDYQMSGLTSYVSSAWQKGGEYYKLMNDIDVSAYNGQDFWYGVGPIGHDWYGDGTVFEGYFDGNGKTVSGFRISENYVYAGLFGTIGSGYYVKNLTVRGDIYWDQAYAVGGVAGRVLAGGYIQNCKFYGNIIGILKTKSNTTCNGVVGTYESGGVINCYAEYIDMKYSYGTTYYLSDWARITTSLYNYKVS